MKQNRRRLSTVVSCSILIAGLSLSAPPVVAQSAKSGNARLCHGCRLASNGTTKQVLFEAAQRFSLRSAHTDAIRRVSGKSMCRELFDSLDLDGPSALENLQLRPPQSSGEQAVCGTGVTAFTAVGKTQIVLCETFHQLPRRSQTAILIHEALHSAGLDEAPNDPEAMTSLEITRMVKRACSL